jgi:hypothetical protein
MQYNSMQWGSEIAPDTFSFGIDKPVVHQSSVVLNAVASLQLGRLRKRPDGGHKRFALDGPGVFAVQRHELAFRDTRPAVMASRRRPLNVSDVEIFTSFNYLTTDSEPVFMGVVDLPRNTDGVDSNKREDSTVVAIHGTRSTIHTGRDIIRPGDSVYWDFPRARTSALDSSQVPAVHIRGMPQNKFLAETRPMNYQSDGGISLYRNVASLLNGSFRRGNDVLPGDRPSAAEELAYPIFPLQSPNEWKAGWHRGYLRTPFA